MSRTLSSQNCDPKVPVLSCPFVLSDQIDFNIDVAASCLGVRTNLIRFVRQSLSSRALDTRQADVESHAEEVTVVCHAQIHFSVDDQVSRQRNFPLAGRKRNRFFNAPATT